MRTMLSSSLLEDRGIAHGFWGRRGGVSDGVFSSLNCGYALAHQRQQLTCCDRLQGRSQ